MTPQEIVEIDEWFDAVQSKQPPNSLAVLCYVRDGMVNIGRSGVDLEVKSFLVDNLPCARELIARALDRAFERGPTDGTPNSTKLPGPGGNGGV